MYIIVCTQMHQAVGPYDNAEEALKVAEEMTEQDQCVYVPVPMTFRGKLMKLEHGGGGESDDRPRPGQYL